MSVIKRSDLITDEAVRWPDEYKKDLEQIIATSKKLGTGTSRKNTTELAKVQNQLSIATERSTKEFVQQKAALNSLNTQTRNAVKDVQNLDNAYDRLSKELNDTRKAYKNLSAAGKANTKEAKAQLAQIRRLDSQLKKIDNTVGQNQRSVGKYSNALRGVTAGMLGWAAAAAVLFRAIGSGLKAVVQLSKANSTLRGILNKTKEETIDLRKEQLKLGGSTVFTATQVTKAQTELARLGLTMSEIIALTPDILDGAVALGVDMAQAAELVAGQLNAFNLSAREGKRVTDVLVRATQISAFNYERLSTSLAIVSPAADAVGISIEGLVSIMTAAVDANVDASTAATGLRNIFIELETKGISWKDAMDKINNSTEKLKVANELFGKRSAIVSKLIAENSEKINENKKALDNASGSAEAFAKAQKDNLIGDKLLWTSAWEGFFATMNEGNSSFSKFTRTTVQIFTSAMRSLTQLMSETSLETDLWRERIVATNPGLKELGQVANQLANSQIELTATIKDGNTTTEKRVLAEEKLSQTQLNRAFILDLITKKIKENQKALEDDTDDTDENTDAKERQFIVLKKLVGLTAELPAKFSEFQLGLFAITDHLFGVNTIDADAEEFISKVGATIKKVGELSKEAREKEEKARKAAAKKQEKEDQIAADIKEAIINKSFEAAGELGNRFADLAIQRISDELTALEFARNRALDVEGQTERAKFEINKRFDEERKKLQKKQVITERANALFQIALNTAIGIANAASKIVTLPLVPIIAAIGAIQAAAVIAAPIPQFDKGKESTPKDYIAGEKRPELRKSRGKWSLVDRPTMFKNSPGDKIVSGKETDSILGTIQDLSSSNILTDQNSILSLLNNNVQGNQKEENLGYILKRNNEDLIRTIKNKKEVNLNVNTRNVKVRERSNGTYINRLDYYYKR